MSDWNTLNKHRVRAGMFASSDSDGFNGAFCLWIGNERVKCIASDGLGWQHVSVSLHDKPTTCPRWLLMCAVKDLFWEPDECVIQFHPPHSEYVNNHPGCLHLWRCTDGREQPVPDSLLVGVKAWNGNMPSRETQRSVFKRLNAPSPAPAPSPPPDGPAPCAPPAP